MILVPSPWRDKPASMRSMCCLWTVFLTLLVTSSVLATALTGPIVGVLDGSTLEVLNGHHAERIRLSGIDCPEKGQAFGTQAKQAASDLAFGKEFTVQTHGYDKYKRTLTDVLLPDGTNVNHGSLKMARAGGIGRMREGIRCWKG